MLPKCIADLVKDRNLYNHLRSLSIEQYFYSIDEFLDHCVIQMWSSG
jgi:hypothetical protein